MPNQPKLQDIVLKLELKNCLKQTLNYKVLVNIIYKGVQTSQKNLKLLQI